MLVSISYYITLDYITLAIRGEIVYAYVKILLGIVLILACLAVSDSRVSIADSGLASIIDNSSTGATITITMYAVASE